MGRSRFVSRSGPTGSVLTKRKADLTTRRLLNQIDERGMTYVQQYPNSKDNKQREHDTNECQKAIDTGGDH